ncbi:MAG: nascent polypeptide-associated complex protein [Candidatus Micrarchaeota archaeon]|nr:MAG: nascent polypeptide-associated complex protein [Candidatus Micrarchaeota archaeon]
MIPNLDPQTLKKTLKRFGIDVEEIRAKRVIIELEDSKRLYIEEPQISKIGNGNNSIFQIAGNVKEEVSESIAEEPSQEDIDFIKQQTGINDTELIRKALKESNNDIAETILKLKKDSQ